MKIVDTGRAPAWKNMEIDSELLKNLEHSQEPVLHLYQFEPEAATYGYFIQPFAHLNEEGVKKRGLQLAKRPTGGGIIFHLWDFTFSLLIPSAHPAYSRNPLDNYLFVNTAVSQILQGQKTELLTGETGASPFCMAKPTIYDLLINGQKIGGAAERCTKFGFLHQGSIALVPPSKEILEDVVKDPQVIQSMQQNSCSLAPSGTPVNEMRDKLKTLFIAEIGEKCRI